MNETLDYNKEKINNKKSFWFFSDTTIMPNYGISFHILPTIVIETGHHLKVEIYFNWLIWLVGIAYGIKESSNG